MSLPAPYDISVTLLSSSQKHQAGGEGCMLICCSQTGSKSEPRHECVSSCDAGDHKATERTSDQMTIEGSMHNPISGWGFELCSQAAGS